MTEQAFYIPPCNAFAGGTDYSHIYMISYQAVVIFMIINFQAIVGAISFSLSKPYRLPIWTNKPYFISLVLLCLFDLWVVFAPGGCNVPCDVGCSCVCPPGEESWPYRIFNMWNFIDASGNSHYQYRYFIFGLVVLNALLTYCIENLIVNKVTKRFDNKLEKKKQKKFDDIMEALQEPELFLHMLEIR